MVSDRVEDFVRARAGQQAAALSARAFHRKDIAGVSGQDHTARIEPSCCACCSFIDRQQSPVSRIDASGGVRSVRDRSRESEDVPLDSGTIGQVGRHVAPFVVGVPAAFRAGIGEGEGVCRRGG